MLPIRIILLPLARHSFSQADSWRGGGVIRIILSSVMSTDFRYCIMLFKFAAYSSTGTCCLGFRSVRGQSMCISLADAKLLMDLWHNITCFLQSVWTRALICGTQCPSTTDSGGVVGKCHSSTPRADRQEFKTQRFQLTKRRNGVGTWNTGIFFKIFFLTTPYLSIRSH